MSSSEPAVPKTAFENVQVVAIPNKDPVTGEIVYLTTFKPEVLSVKAHDAVINYQLVAPTPEGVKFTGLTVSPAHNEQLSEPSLSKSGLMLTFSDANTVEETLSITLHFIDKDLIEFNVDPDLDNYPPPD